MVLTDLDQARVDAGRRARARRDRQAAATAAACPPTRPAGSPALVTGSLTKDAFADADFVIEAVFEEMEVKQQVFAEVEAVVRPDCVLATNTSSLSVTEMASGLAHPARVVGFHFFNPVAMMPLVEVVRGEATDDASLATALAVGRALKKNCVLVKDAPAFVVNRLLTRFLGEIIGCRRRGHAVRGRRARAGPARPADVPVLPAAAGRPGRRAARGRDAARGVPGPVRGLAQAPRPGRRGQDRGLRAGLHRRRVGGGAARRRRPPVDRGGGQGARARGAGRGDQVDARRGRRGRARRTSTCA